VNKQARVIAFYLPQFHPIPENDEWWGKGFTEWTNVAKAKPMFRGHYQPHVPAEILGYYDLRVPEMRIAQAEMAREYGIEAFCYYHYWFAGKRMLERPFNEVLSSGEPDFPFCLCWANHTWTGVWAGARGRTLIEQSYPGEDDYRKHFNTLLQAFSDRRYLKVDGKPLFLVYNPMEIPHIDEVTNLWRDLSIKSGLKGLYLVGTVWKQDYNPKQYGFDASTPRDYLPRRQRGWIPWREPVKKVIQYYLDSIGMPTVISYKRFVYNIIRQNKFNAVDYPCVIPNWDNTPRAGKSGVVLHKSTPELFRIHLRSALDAVKTSPTGRRIIFIKSWNEWAEGNHLEPDLKFGKAYLQVIKEEIQGR